MIRKLNGFCLLAVSVLSLSIAAPGENVQAQSFTCSGGRPACLDYGDKICSSSSKCVSDDAVCFDSYTCNNQGVVCKSDYDKLSVEADRLLQNHNTLVSKYNDLADQHRNLVSEYSDLERKLRDLKTCLYGASNLDDVRYCL